MNNRRPNFNDGMYLQVIGVGSARPVPERHPSSQVLRVRDRVFLIDCGEGTQMQLLKYKVSISRLHRIFLTHLHGDHCLGVPGLLSTMSLVGFQHPVHIYGPEGTKDFVDRIVKYFCRTNDEGNIVAHEINPDGEAIMVYEDHVVEVHAFELKHKVSCVGYRFDEKPLQRHLRRDQADYYGVPVAYFGRIKQGDDYIMPDGTIVPNGELTSPNRPPYSFAYCSDTTYFPEIVPFIQGVDLLYHETTFGEELSDKAHARGHSTALEAAKIARLAGVKALLMGHYSTRYKTIKEVEMLRLEAESQFPNVIAGEEGLIIDVSEIIKAK